MLYHMRIIGVADIRLLLRNTLRNSIALTAGKRHSKRRTASSHDDLDQTNAARGSRLPLAQASAYFNNGQI